MLLALPINNATAAQATNQNDRLKRASRTTSKPRGPQPIYLTPKVAEILRLNKASISDDVIVAYIEKSPSDYDVTSRQLISLRDAGMSERVLKTLAEHRSPTPEELGAPPFLSPNGVPQASDPTGRWVYMPGYGWSWQSAAPFSQPYGAETFGLPPIFASVSDGGGTVLADDGHHERHHPHVEHHNAQDGDQHSTGQHAHGSSSSHTATPWLAHSAPASRVSNVPFGVLGASTPMAGQSRFLPVDSAWSAGRPQGLAANIPYSPIGAGTVGYANPFLPVGGQVPSGNLPPYGIAGQPLAANNGAYPFLPVGGVPANGSLPPYGIAGQPLVPNSGAYPFLPVGGQPASGNLPPYGIAPSSFGHGYQMAQFRPFPYLPAAPMLPAPPTLYNPATFPSPNSPPTGFYPLSPPTGFSTSAMRAGGAMPAGGFHGGGFHGGGGGGHGGGGGGHR
jgi:hypothetical protein